MIRSLRALARLRFRLFLNSMMKTGRRDTLEQISRALASVLPIVLVIALLPTALVLAVAGFFGGRILASGSDMSAGLVAVTRLGLLSLTLMVVLLPLVRSSGGSSAGMTRFMLLPIPRRVLLLSELTGGFGDPWLGLVVPLLLAVPLGLVAGGASAAAPFAFGAAVALLLALAALNACSSLGMALLFRDRRRGEWLTFVFMGVVSVAFLIPAAFPEVEDWLRDRPAESTPATAARANGSLDERLDAWLPVFTRVLPGELYASAVKAGVAGERIRGVGVVTGLVLWCGAVVGVAGALHSRLLDSPAGGSRRGSRRKSRLRLSRYLGLSAGASAVARATVQLALRTVRGKIAAYFNFPILGVLLLLFRFRPEMQFPDGSLIGVGQVGALGGIAFSWISTQPLLLNLFANDRAGLTLQFLAPISTRDLVLGKMAGGVALVTFSAVLCTAVSLVVAPGGHAIIWAAIPLVFLSATLIIGPVSVLLSAVFPKNTDLSRLGKAGNPHNLAGVLGFFLVPLAMAPPVALTAAAVWWLEQPLLGLLLAAMWAAVAGLIFVPLLRIAAASVKHRAENLMLIAVGR